LDDDAQGASLNASEVESDKEELDEEEELHEDSEGEDSDLMDDDSAIPNQLPYCQNCRKTAPILIWPNPNSVPCETAAVQCAQAVLPKGSMGSML
jgi:hypothetical protein